MRLITIFSFLLFFSSLHAQICEKLDSIDGQAVYLVVDSMPQYPGGETELFKFLTGEFRYPHSEDFQGSIYLSFDIDTVGQVRNVCILKPHRKGEISEVEKEALRVVNAMPLWTPGKMNNRKVPVRFNLPIKF